MEQDVGCQINRFDSQRGAGRTVTLALRAVTGNAVFLVARTARACQLRVDRYSLVGRVDGVRRIDKQAKPGGDAGDCDRERGKLDWTRETATKRQSDCSNADDKENERGIPLQVAGDQPTRAARAGQRRAKTAATSGMRRT